MINYREKIYKYYSSNSGKNLAPENIENFSSQKPYLQNIIDKHFPKDKEIKILELGCGYGIFGHFIQENGYQNYIGIDASDEQVKEAERLNIKNIKFADLITYLKSLDKESIDLVIAIDVIEHFNKEELSDIIDDIFTVLKKDGKVITHQPNGESIFSNSIRYGDFTHELAFTRSSISQLFLSSNFKSVISYEDFPTKHSFKSKIRYILWKYFVRKFYCFLILIETGSCNERIYSQNFLTVAFKNNSKV